MEHVARHGVLNLHLGIDTLFPKETRGQEEDSSQTLGRGKALPYLSKAQGKAEDSDGDR